MIADCGVALRIERDRADGRPVARRTGPARRVSLAGLEIRLISCGQNGPVFKRMALRRGDVSDAAVPMFEVVPAHEVAPPDSGIFKVGEAARREFGAVLRRLVERLHESVVVRDARARLRWLDAQPVQNGEHRGGLERAAVGAMQHRLVGHRVHAFGQRGAL